LPRTGGAPARARCSVPRGTADCQRSASPLQTAAVDNSMLCRHFGCTGVSGAVEVLGSVLMSVVVRPLGADEFRIYLEIVARAIRGLAAAYYSSEAIEGWVPKINDDSLRELETNDDGEVRLIAELDGRFAGIGALVPDRSELRACYVVPEAARRGCGSAIVREIERKGARNELVRKVQLALAGQGFDPQGADGKFGKDTEAAVKAFQQARSFEATGRVDVSTWTALLGTGIPNTQERSLQLTAAFEGHGFTLAQGNFDGAGITWGIVGFTLKHGELRKIILTVFDENPVLVQQAFGNNTEELIEILKSPKAVQMRFADSISIGTTKAAIKEPWKSAFKTFGESGSSASSSRMR
jgi:GNAT superfamily N-acetyltransferase